VPAATAASAESQYYTGPVGERERIREVAGFLRGNRLLPQDALASITGRRGKIFRPTPQRGRGKDRISSAGRNRRSKKTD